jgi:hypothetical protein
MRRRTQERRKTVNLWAAGARCCKSNRRMFSHFSGEPCERADSPEDKFHAGVAMFKTRSFQLEVGRA